MNIEQCNSLTDVREQNASLHPDLAESVYRIMINQFVELELNEYNAK